MEQPQNASFENPQIQKTFSRFLFWFVGMVWLLLFTKYILQFSYRESPYFDYLLILEDLFLVAIFPVTLLYFQRVFHKHVLKQGEDYKELFKKNPHPMWVYDMNTLNFLMVNDSAIALYGYTADDFSKMLVSEICPEEDIPALVNDIETEHANFNLSYHWAGKWRHKKKNGELIYVEVSSHQILFNGRKASLVLAYDITEKVMQEWKLQTLNQELEQKVQEKTNDFLLLNKTLIEQNKIIKATNLNLSSLSEELSNANDKLKEHSDLKNRFISMVSHEFRTPLSTIGFAADFIHRYHDRIDTAKLVEKTASISKQVAHMNALLNDVLTVGRIDTDTIKTNIEAVDLPAFIEGIVKEVTAAAKHTHVVDLQMENVPAQFHSDEKLLRNIFINLLNNAIKYSPDRKSIRFGITGTAKEIHFDIRDNGIGIPQDEIDKIFTAFYRSKRAENIQGTGLGLSIVKRAVDLMKGTIRVESEINKGSSFTVLLPLNHST